MYFSRADKYEKDIRKYIPISQCVVFTIPSLCKTRLWQWAITDIICHSFGYQRFNKILLMSKLFCCCCFLHVYTWFCYSVFHNIDYTHLHFRKGTGVVWGSSEVQGMHWEHFGCFWLWCTPEKKVQGQMRLWLRFARWWEWATWFNTLRRAWHINQFGNIICHEWRCILQPNSWLKALLVMPIRPVFTDLTRPTCQFARLIGNQLFSGPVILWGIFYRTHRFQIADLLALGGFF